MLVPEFGGAYRGLGNTLIVRVTDTALSRSGGPAAARAALERDLAEHGRAELRVTFELAKYDYVRLNAWMRLLLDSLGALNANSWGLDARTSRIHVGVADTASERRVLRAAAEVGIPADAIYTGIEHNWLDRRPPPAAAARRVH